MTTPTPDAQEPTGPTSAARPAGVPGEAPEGSVPKHQHRDVQGGVARAAVVMAHIVAARLKSGVPITSDDPDRIKRRAWTVFAPA